MTALAGVLVDTLADVYGLWLRLSHRIRRRWRRRLLYHEARLLSGQMRQAGKDFSIGERVVLRHPEMLSIGDNVRILDHAYVDCLSNRGVRLGSGVLIERSAWIRATATASSPGVGLEVGDNTSVGAYSVLGAGAGISIGRNVLIGQMVCINSENHRFDDPDLPIALQGNTREGIVIEDDCWFGSGAIVLDGVRIGRGSVIGAGAVVTRDIPDMSIAAGVPARVLGSRLERSGSSCPV